MFKKIILLFFLTLGFVLVGFYKPIDVFVGKGLVDVPKIDDTLKIFFVGDVMLSRQIGKIAQSENDFKYHFNLIQPYLSSADLVVANLESPVSLRGTKVGSIYSFRADPKMLEGLRFANIGLVTLANNHIWDYGREAFFDTMSHLASSSIGFVGVGQDIESARKPFLFEKNGNKIIFLGFTDLAPSFLLKGDASPAVSPSSVENIRDAIKESIAEYNPDLVVAMFHWGIEYKTIHNKFQENLADIAVKAGADLVIGHHPHVVQDVGSIDGVPVAYSLGNFIFDQNFSKDTSEGLIFEVYIKDKKIEKVATTTVIFNKNFQPYIKSE